ncbi:MAG: VCBS repeat-containing protein [Anaerolineae bacterium]|nr:VCBS repeat-containing protein [Anaerolineae bacterium]
MSIKNSIYIVCGLTIAFIFISLSRNSQSAEIPFLLESHTISASLDNPNSVHTADINNDGQLEVLSTGANAERVILWQRVGSDWLPCTIQDGYDGAASINTGDFDGDGDLDVIAVAYQAMSIDWWENTQEMCTSWIRHNITSSLLGPISIDTADINGDGDIDVISASEFDDRVLYWANVDGNGTDWESSMIGGFDGARSVHTADIDGDGHLDVIAAASGVNTVAWWRNNDGSGRDWSRFDIDASFTSARSVFAADLDHDGDTDVIGASAGDPGDGIRWWENDGDGGDWTQHNLDQTFVSARSVFATDMDGDGDNDIVAGAGNTLAWWENDSGQSQSWVKRIVGAHAGISAVWGADVDSDGDQDFLYASGDDDEVGYWENLTIHRAAAYPLSQNVDLNFVGATSVITADIDGDGALDLVGAASSADGVTWWKNATGDGMSWNATIIASSFLNANSVLAHDIDRDGDLDVIGAAGQPTNRIAWWENVSGNGLDWSEHVVANDLQDPRALQLIDFDNDGDQDIVAAQASTIVSRWENLDGNGTSWEENDISTSFADPQALYPTDVDQDGDIDLVGAGTSSDQVVWWENDNLGTQWIVHTISADVNEPVDLYAADIDGDSDSDVVIITDDASGALWVQNIDGEGNSWSQHDIVDYHVGGGRDIFAADLDADGDIDVLAASGHPMNSIDWWENQDGQGLQWKQTIVRGGFNNATSIHAGDIDGDGKTDIIGAADNADDVVWWRNVGGQFTLDTEAIEFGVVNSGDQVDLLKITAIHNGRQGDEAIELETLALRFEDQGGTPLTTADANALIDNVSLYLDNGDGSFVIGEDTSVTSIETINLSDGVMSWSLPSGETLIQFESQVSRTYFLVVKLTTASASHMPNQFQVTHLTNAINDETSTAIYQNRPLQADLSISPDVVSRLIQVEPHTVFAPLIRVPLPTPTPTSTSTPRPTNTPTPAMPTPTNTPVAPTNTPTPTIPTNTPTPITPTDTPTPTNTPGSRFG